MTTTDTVQYLYDRTQVSDLLYRFASLLDTKQWQAHIDLYADDGVLVLPWATVTKQMMRAAGGPGGFYRCTPPITSAATTR